MIWEDFKNHYLVRFRSPVPAVIAAGVLSAYYFGLTGTFWAVTGEFTRWGGHVLQFLGVDLSHWGYFKIIGLQGTPLTRVDGVMVIGMFAGCFSAALWANNVKLRWPHHRIRIGQALVGGIIAGFGARLAMGCNLAAFSPAFRSSRCMPGFLPSPPPSARWRAPRSACCPCSAFRSSCKKSARRSRWRSARRWFGGACASAWRCSRSGP